MLGEAASPGREHESGTSVPSPTSPAPNSLPEVPETIELEVRTSTASGLLLWQGVVSLSVQIRVLGFLASWWPVQWERGRWGPQLSGTSAFQALVTLCFSGRRWERLAEARTSSVLGFRMGTLSSGGFWHLLPPGSLTLQGLF